MVTEELLDYLAQVDKKHHKHHFVLWRVDMVRDEIAGLRKFAALKPHTMPAQVCSTVADGYEKRLQGILGE